MALVFAFPAQVRWTAGSHTSLFFDLHSMEAPSAPNVLPASGPDQHSPEKTKGKCKIIKTMKMSLVGEIVCPKMFPLRPASDNIT